jgi:Thioredoxin like C-terminal domain/Redoxin
MMPKDDNGGRTDVGSIGSHPPESLNRSAPELPLEGRLPALDGATGWLNSESLTTSGLQGKVVLVSVWTYTCINWLRSLPYVRGWADRYKEQGLVVIGVHTPEFDFEHDLENVRRAVRDRGIDYPVAVDGDYAVWDGLHNHYWPALYFVDAEGHIRHHHFGEGSYERSEQVLQRLLAGTGRAGRTGPGKGLLLVEAHGVETAADWDNLESPESYIGYGRAENNISLDPIVLHRPHIYRAPAQLALHKWALSGDWTLREQSAVSNASNTFIAHHFHARDLHLVMAPPSHGTAARFRVTIDGQPPGRSHGLDVDGDGYGTLIEPRLYQLIRQPLPIVDRGFQIEFLDPGAHAYVFTFG